MFAFSGIYCDPVIRTTKIGESVSVLCYTKDITNISRVSVRDKTSELLNIQNKLAPYSEANDVLNLTILSVEKLFVKFTNITCTREGEYVVEVNGAVTAKFKIIIIGKYYCKLHVKENE